MAHNLSHLLILLRPLGLIYGGAMRVREKMFNRGLRQRHFFAVPVISVGNLTMGGSGKTPIVIHLAQLCMQHGLKPAVVSRGYGGMANAPTNVVSDGERIYLDCKESGDEPRLIAEEVPGTVVLTGKRRKDPCKAAVEKYNCDIIILDDGFQHLAVNRDIDLVLFNSSLAYEDLHVFPAGFLRESFAALQRADCLVITGCPSNAAEEYSTLLSYFRKNWPDKLLFQTRYVPNCLHDKHGNSFPLDHLDGPTFAFCGIASPHRFKETLARFSIEACGFTHFSDHYQYTNRSVVNIQDEAKRKGATALLTTEKDLVKLKRLKFDLPLYALAMKVETEPLFDEFLLAKLDEWKDSLR